MSRILYIIRHAQAVNGLNQSDAERNLTSIGEQQAKRVGKFFKIERHFSLHNPVEPSSSCA